MSKTFCILPWVQLATSSAGMLRVCCNSTPSQNLLRIDGNIQNLAKCDVKKAFNSDTSKAIRQQLLAGEKPEMCSRCFSEEAAGLKSARQSFNEQFEEYIEDSIESTGDDGSVPFNIRYLDLRLGNLCNAACRMCNPYSSSQLLDEWSILHPDFSEEERKYVENSRNWIDSQHTWDNLAEVIDTVKLIYLTGGEPTLANKQYDLLNMCIERGAAENIVLKYNTNLSNIQTKMLDCWKHFKEIRLNCSIDGYGELNNYIRYPLNWDSIDKNLKKLHTAGSNIVIGVHITVQMYNILRLTDLLDFLMEEYNISPYLNILDRPLFFRVQTLPPLLKEKAINDLSEWIITKKPINALRSRIEGLIEFIRANDLFDEHFTQFREQTEKFDLLRKQNILDVVPEFGGYLR